MTGVQTCALPIYKKFESSAMMNAYIISVLIFAVILASSILGVVRYIKGKRGHDKGKVNR